MSFQSAGFFAFFVLTLLVYHRVPSRAKAPLLLAANLFFYAQAGVGHLALLAAAVLLSYGAARGLTRLKDGGPRKALLAAALVVLAGNLCFFKYYDQFGAALNGMAAGAGLPVLLPDRGLAPPLGVSFYTFLLMAYLIDQYRRKYLPEKNLVRFAAFATFFPLISSGPIERGDGLLSQMERPEDFSYETFCQGASRMLWGFFKKFVIADTLGGMVGAVFGKPDAYTGPYLALAALLYSYQLYCDFSGYSDIAIGAARALGYRVRENFNRPFAARSFNDLWKRWHNSLTGWFREYLYFPLGGSRRGTARTYINIVIIFLVSGIWHGTGMTFAVWGLMNGVYMAVGRATQKPRAALAARNPLYRNRTVRAMLQIACVYLLFTSCIVFFRAATMADALYIYGHLFTGWGEALASPSGVIAALKSMGIGRVTGLLMLVSIAGCELVEWRAARAGRDTGLWMRSLPAGRRLALYYGVALLVLAFGKMGVSSFIYFNF